jgi:hypothetical protein
MMLPFDVSASIHEIQPPHAQKYRIDICAAPAASGGGRGAGQTDNHGGTQRCHAGSSPINTSIYGADLDPFGSVFV